MDGVRRLILFSLVLVGLWLTFRAVRVSDYWLTRALLYASAVGVLAFAVLQFMQKPTEPP